METLSLREAAEQAGTSATHAIPTDIQVRMAQLEVEVARLNDLLHEILASRDDLRSDCDEHFLTDQAQQRQPWYRRVFG